MRSKSIPILAVVPREGFTRRSFSGHLFETRRAGRGQNSSAVQGNGGSSVRNTRSIFRRAFLKEITDDRACPVSQSSVIIFSGNEQLRERDAISKRERRTILKKSVMILEITAIMPVDLESPDGDGYLRSFLSPVNRESVISFIFFFFAVSTMQNLQLDRMIFMSAAALHCFSASSMSAPVTDQKSRYEPIMLSSDRFRIIISRVSRLFSTPFNFIDRQSVMSNTH